MLFCGFSSPFLVNLALQARQNNFAIPEQYGLETEVFLKSVTTMYLAPGKKTRLISPSDPRIDGTIFIKVHDIVSFLKQ